MYSRPVVLQFESVSFENSLIFTDRILAGMIFGALIGVERQRHAHPAGLRTNTLVSMGASLYMALPFLSGGDASHVAGQIVTGIGFLGGGVILREGLNVRGLNTAATIWCSAAVGALSGAGLLVEAAIGTAAIVFVNVAFRPLALLIPQPIVSLDQETSYRVHVICVKKKEARIRSFFLKEISRNSGLRLQGIDMSQADQATHLTARLTALSKNNHLIEELVAQASLEEGVSSTSWELV